MKHYTHSNTKSRIGRFKNYTVYVCSTEKSLPHFYFRGNKKNGCIRLDAPEYFFYDKYQDRLDSKEVESLINFLNSPHRVLGDAKITNWQVICVYWNDDNPNYLIDYKLKMPDYNQLKSA